MDIGCHFRTPINISDDIANHAGKRDLVVDLFSGSGNLYKAFLRKGNVDKAIAFDINSSLLANNSHNHKVISREVNCLDPTIIKKRIEKYNNKNLVFVLNPPFKRINKKNEQKYWEAFNGYNPKIFTQRIECIAIASALYAAPLGSVIYVILPVLVLKSRWTSSFFNILNDHFSMKLVDRYKRVRFSHAEVDVAVVSLTKEERVCITNLLDSNKSIELETDEIRKPLILEYNIMLFRGKVRCANDRKIQISVKDLKHGGVTIKGNINKFTLVRSKESNYSTAGDILVARVGQRMLGRVGIISDGYVLTNESVFTLRIAEKQMRKYIFEHLKSHSFKSWCLASARGTANYFISKDDFESFINKAISNYI